MRTIIILSPTGAADRDVIEALERPEAERVEDLRGEGRLLQIYLQAEANGAVLMLDVSDRAEARSIVESLPLVREGQLTAAYMPLEPWPQLADLLRERGEPLPAWWPDSQADAA